MKIDEMEQYEKMKLKLIKKSSQLTIMLFVLGIFLVLSSNIMGQGLGDKVVQMNSGIMDTDQLNRIIENTTSNFQIIGTIVSLFGGSGFLLSCIATYNKL